MHLKGSETIRDKFHRLLSLFEKSHRKISLRPWGDKEEFLQADTAQQKDDGTNEGL